MNNDYILRLAEDLGKFAAKVLLHKEQEEYENINLDSLSSEEILHILLKKLVFEGKYNEAENILFEELHKNPSNDLISIGKDFYNILLSKSDEELIKGKFSREEVLQGLKDMEKIIEN
ncbi:DUF6483 family protein [Clostridium sp. UBA6640]|uniref:DUF6483 family protein n=1 Tax=Clostridium sp. UBA6640 TaxID=1946370 RepID=UPI0025BB1566|nr:DUF6483 family protein [Clostridium sp. UBA6640]